MPSAEDEGRDVDVAFLDAYAETQWEVRSGYDAANRELTRLADDLAFHGRVGDRRSWQAE